MKVAAAENAQNAAIARERGQHQFHGTQRSSGPSGTLQGGASNFAITEK